MLNGRRTTRVSISNRLPVFSCVIPTTKLKERLNLRERYISPLSQARNTRSEIACQFDFAIDTLFG